MSKRGLAWPGALSVMVITTVLVVLDLSDASVHRYWSNHAFTASVLSGVLVLLLTVLIVDRVTHGRQVRNQSRVIAAQAAIIVGQADRTVDALKQASKSDGDQNTAAEELRTYTQMLLTSAPVLIDAQLPRAFLETAQRFAGLLFRAIRDGRVDSRLDSSLQDLRAAAAPLLQALSAQQRVAVTSVASDSADG
jgi:TRAP-type C4-dicarboxylate transport system permease large subunit